MHCPNCATENPDQHRYCRSCGMELKMVSALLAHHRHRSGPLKADRSEEEITFKYVRLIVGSLVTLAVGLLIALAGPLIGNFQFLATIGGLVFLAGLAVVMFASFRLAWLKAKPKGRPPVVEAITRSDLDTFDANLLEPPIPSITESTTKLMDDVPQVPRPQQASGQQSR